MAGVNGRVAIVTGAGNPQGIGYGIAKALREAGASVVLGATTARIHERCAELGGGGNLAGFVGDLTDRTTAAGLIQFALERFGRVDILVNNAGMQQTGVETSWPAVDSISDDAWSRALRVSLDTCFFVTRAAIPAMKKNRHGRIINMSSVSGPVVTFSGGGAYGAAKAAMIGYTRSLALELGSDGIIANAIAPGWINNGGNSDQLMIGGDNTPIGRPGRPEEVGSLAVYLASDECSYLTGQMIVIDGGNTIQEYKGPPL
ncbi:SDR family NAD(P)-dependent oxidoreductase [Rhizobium leguminosarum]|uniref:SDR family NAD(P)-dependent oxidoreductase n=1 Tax=Rhizobium leguminosarum TaxID=384 RepID=UPI0024A94AA5|nr:SDR family NAD(P)-dependent oxidoreductase [Rhizobium leguminosarum]MDI5930019.1 SDR family NAD(P)-dependent oxidoreductase [Rhizobium leguminosarum]